MEHRIVQARDGAELAVWSSGPPDGEPIVFVHGFSLDHTTWDLVAERLAAAGHRIVTADLRGHGQSTLGSTPPTLNRLVGDLDEILRALGMAAAHFVGHSLGAVVVLSARVDDRLADSIKSVTSIAGTEQSIQNPVMKVGARFFSSSFGIWLLRRRRPGRMMIATWFGKKPAPDDLDWIRALSADCTPATRVAVASATGAIDLRPTFDLAGAPTLVMCGRRDKATPLKFSRRISTAIDGAELHVVDDAGHMVIVENPSIVAGLLSTWFSRHR